MSAPALAVSDDWPGCRTSYWQPACTRVFAMNAYDFDREDFDREEIDTLVRELMADPRVPLRASPIVSQSVEEGLPPQPAIPVAGDQAALRPGSRWTNVRLQMPSPRSPGFKDRFALASAIRLPRLWDLNRLSTVPGSVALVRMWVGLGAVYSASMTFWPYPKTYLWGLVLYLLCLGLVLVTGVWGARLSWEARLGAAHTVALGAALWAVGLATVETLPPT